MTARVRAFVIGIALVCGSSASADDYTFEVLGFVG